MQRFIRTAALFIALCASPTLQDAPTTDPSYVVQLHSSRDGFIPSAATTSSKTYLKQLMTTEAGQRFECFLPQPSTASEDKEETTNVETEEHQDAQFLAFGRAAYKKIRPKCLQYQDHQWIYEICPGVLIRRVSTSTLGASTATTADSSKSADAEHSVEEIGSFIDDQIDAIKTYSEYKTLESMRRVQFKKKPIYTQRFRRQGAVPASSTSPSDLVTVQFICSGTVDDRIDGVDWLRPTAQAPTSVDREKREPLSFLVTSKLFCDPKYVDADDENHGANLIRNMLQPLVNANTCIKRNEGWWTYEFCFGRGIRQYHRDADGKITAEFSLGTINYHKNQELLKSGSALVSEHLDATHDTSRPAFLEVYTDGTFCKEFNTEIPRNSKVYYYCSHGGMNHHFLAVKETQTCSYTIKISTPTLCDHPHFIQEDHKSEDQAEVVHCIPVEDESAANTRASAQPAFTAQVAGGHTEL